jgi:uncharacterized membrane protein
MAQAHHAPPPLTRRWRLRFGDQVFGPFDRAELEMLLAEGRLGRSTLLAEEGMGEDWRYAGDIPELQDLFQGRGDLAKARPPKLIVRGREVDNTILHLTYALYAASFFNGFTLIVGVIIAYVKRNDARGSWQESHFDWLIRTFWWTVLFMVLGGAATIIMIGFLVLFLAGVWLLYRIIKGWVRLAQWRAVEAPEAFF